MTTSAETPGLIVAAKICDEILSKEVMSKHASRTSCIAARSAIEKCATEIRARINVDSEAVSLLKQIYDNDSIYGKLPEELVAKLNAIVKNES